MKIYVQKPGSTGASALPASVVRVSVDYDATPVPPMVTCWELAGSQISQERIDDWLDGDPMPAIGTDEWDSLFDGLSENYFEEMGESTCSDEILEELEDLAGGGDVVLVGKDIQIDVVMYYLDNNGISYTEV